MVAQFFPRIRGRFQRGSDYSPAMLKVALEMREIRERKQV